MTQLESAFNHKVSPVSRVVAQREGVAVETLLRLMRQGKAVICANPLHWRALPCAVGSGLKTKVNANIGTSTDNASVKEEIEKLKAAIACGADAVMDLSVGGNLRAIRKEILARSTVPVGTVPIYEIAVNAQGKRGGDFLDFNTDDIWEVLEDQARAGVDFFTIHAGVTKKSLSALGDKKRVMGIVSRGGAMLAAWMARNKRENPFYAYFDRVLDIAYRYDVTLSLGDGLRPGSILDATDKAQIAELTILGQLARRAMKKHVQVMIEGPGHVPLDQIKKNIELEKKLCHGAPFYVLGPLVTDVAAGYDHITAAIGGALAAWHGADFLCYVTPAEHLRHPSVVDVREGVVASRIAAHAADIAKKIPGAIAWDTAMSKARKRRDWKKQIALSIDPVKAKQYRLSSQPGLADVCTMCGRFCSIKLMEECGKKKNLRV